MRLFRMIRFSMGTIMIFVLMVAAGMALFVKIQQHTEGLVRPAVLPPGWTLDVPSLFLLAIALTAVALGSWKEHTAVQIMLQVTLACFSCLTLIWIGEAQYERAIRYWCQGTFAATVTIPMLARRFVKSGLPRGPRRDWWKKTCEAVFFSFLTMLLVTAGGLLQGAIYTAASAISARSTPAMPPTPVLPPAAPGPPPTRPDYPPSPVG
jgi:peptidoglycan/LPS O-acetylase OafA/YrhL